MRAPRCHARQHQHALAVERLDPHRARLEPLRSDVLEHQVLAALGAHHAGARKRDAVTLLAGGCKHGDELSDAQPAGVVLDAKMHRDRLVAIGKASAG